MSNWAETRDMLMAINDIRQEMLRVRPILQSLVTDSDDVDKGAIIGVAARIFELDQDDLHLLLILAVVTIKNLKTGTPEKPEGTSE